MQTKDTLRLVLFSNCHKSCAGCCNKDIDYSQVPAVSSFAEYTYIMITGGEPMLAPWTIKSAVDQIREQNDEVKIVLYTALPKHKEIYEILDIVDGITVTIHDQSDVDEFFEFQKMLPHSMMYNKSFRLNIFNDIEINKQYVYSVFKIKDNIEWIKDCPLPENEVLMRWM